MAEQHRTEVLTLRGKYRRLDEYRAKCSCGYLGTQYDDRAAAEDDADEHVRLATEER